jgi:hypothetical protein
MLAFRPERELIEKIWGNINDFDVRQLRSSHRFRFFRAGVPKPQIAPRRILGAATKKETLEYLEPL